jgi:Family of unknown function (DUF5690)
MKNRINRWLQNPLALTLWASVAAFSTYFCMYAFRKPFTAGTFEGLTVWGIDLKVMLVVAQVLGYMLSKFIGIKVISEMSSKNRPLSIVVLIGFSGLALLIFNAVPTEWQPLCLFFNGLPLGLIWGIVFSFLEGRRMTEALGAGLAVSFIISSGVVKTVGKTLMLRYGFTEFQMPFITGSLFFIPLLMAVWMLSKIPPPSVLDLKSRSPRQPMTGLQRRLLFKKYSFGIVFLTAFYFILTAFRDFRDNFIVELWQSLGYDNAEILTTAELPVALCVLIIVASTVFIKNNAVAFWCNHLFILLGGLTLLISTYAYEMGFISPVAWMMLVGFGMYLAYILFQSLIFERMMATFKEIGNVGFLMYVADAFGYLGSILVMFYKHFSPKTFSWLSFFTHSSYIVGWSCLLLMSASFVYFFQRYETQKINHHAVSASIEPI